MSELLIQERKWQPMEHCVLCVIETAAETLSLDPDCTSVSLFLWFLVVHCILSWQRATHEE